MYVKNAPFIGLSNPLFHSGGGNGPHALSLGLVPLLWMENQRLTSVFVVDHGHILVTGHGIISIKTDQQYRFGVSGDYSRSCRSRGINTQLRMLLLGTYRTSALVANLS